MIFNRRKLTVSLMQVVVRLEIHLRLLDIWTGLENTCNQSRLHWDIVRLQWSSWWFVDDISGKRSVHQWQHDAEQPRNNLTSLANEQHDGCVWSLRYSEVVPIENERVFRSIEQGDAMEFRMEAIQTPEECVIVSECCQYWIDVQYLQGRNSVKVALEESHNGINHDVTIIGWLQINLEQRFKHKRRISYS